ncbi:hypothetical protein TWF506_008046 [Arthrobotrys conoides]|uniref:Uncharacterized protein n=1 Tax=Arthrobotrys conoides TaxID=74498 RepID=A0AAN8NV77_9PEZI
MTTNPLSPLPYLTTFPTDTPHTIHLKTFSTILSYIDRILALPRSSHLTTTEFKEEIQSFLYWSFDSIKQSRIATNAMNKIIEMAARVYEDRREGREIGVPLPAYLRYRLRRFYEAEV